MFTIQYNHQFNYDFQEKLHNEGVLNLLEPEPLQSFPAFIYEETIDLFNNPRKSFGKRKSFNGNKEQVFYGLLIEGLISYFFNNPVRDYRVENNSGYDGGYDIIYNNKKIDIKGYCRTVNLKPNYAIPIPYSQLINKNNEATHYIFASWNKKNNSLQIIGALSKEFILDNFILLKENEKNELYDFGISLKETPERKTFLIQDIPINIISIFHLQNLLDFAEKGSY